MNTLSKLLMLFGVVVVCCSFPIAIPFVLAGWASNAAERARQRRVQAAIQSRFRPL
jgi:hypothetical protein